MGARLQKFRLSTYVGYFCADTIIIDMDCEFIQIAHSVLGLELHIVIQYCFL
jgi:hypothetical protein